MAKSDFEERRARREAGYERASENAAKRSDEAYQKSHSATDGIVFGQPILVGHHSEGKHRRAIKKANDQLRKSIDEDKKAEYFARRAEAVRNNTAIFSDDPNAVEKLAEKIERLEKQQTLMREANKLVRKNDAEGLLDLGFSEKSVAALLEGDRMGRKGFPTYALTNQAANIRRLKQRLEAETAKAKATTSERMVGTVKIVDNVLENRTQIIFPTDRVSPEIYRKLKGRGWRRTREGIWQRHLSGQAQYLATEVADAFMKETENTAE